MDKGTTRSAKITCSINTHAHAYILDRIIINAIFYAPIQHIRSRKFASTHPMACTFIRLICKALHICGETEKQGNKIQ